MKGKDIALFFATMAASVYAAFILGEKEGAKQPAPHGNSALAAKLSKDIEPELQRLFVNHDALAAMVVATTAADGGVAVAAIRRTVSDVSPSQLLDRAVAEIRGAQPTMIDKPSPAADPNSPVTAEHINL